MASGVDTEVQDVFAGESLRIPESLAFDATIRRRFKRHFDAFPQSRLFELVQHNDNWPILASRLRLLLRRGG